MFFAWVKSKFNGKKVDFWNQAKDLGRIEFRKVLNLNREEKKVAFSVTHAFMVKDGDKWIDVLHEVWTQSGTAALKTEDEWDAINHTYICCRMLIMIGLAFAAGTANGHRTEQFDGSDDHPRLLLAITRSCEGAEKTLRNPADRRQTNRSRVPRQLSDTLSWAGTLNLEGGWASPGVRLGFRFRHVSPGT